MDIITHTFRAHNLDGFYLNLAESIIENMETALTSKPYCTMALAGGNTPIPLYSLLSSPKFSKRISWEKVHFFPGDERFVPHTHPDSNFRMMHKSFFSKMNVPHTNIHSIPTSLPTPKAAADKFEDTIRSTFKHLTPKKRNSASIPYFDLILLGLGNDGHTASLFPGTTALNEQKHLVRAITHLPPGISPSVPRVTMTLPLINNAETIFFLAADPRKATIVEEIVSNPKAAAKTYPAARVQAREVHWFYVV